MSDAKHTPGPWFVHDRWYIGTTPTGETHAEVKCCAAVPHTREQEHEANARLIAAAPDLLAALKGVLRVADRKTDEFDAARAAIIRAEGRS